jgi:hypothetical protein
MNGLGAERRLEGGETTHCGRSALIRYSRYLEEDPAATVEEAALAASSLIALTGGGYQEVGQTRRAMTERGVCGCMWLVRS